MYLYPIFISGLLLAGAEGVLGGSRLWEVKAPNKRTNPSPDYLTVETLNSTSSLVRRAMSIKNQPYDNKQARIWPNKKIRWCFHDDNADLQLRGLWNAAIDLWAELKDHGFSYEEVSRSVCRSQSQRSTVLHIYYNAGGRLLSTLGIPAIDEEANRDDPDPILGPYSHLSDMQGIGMNDVNANVAHELGHVWGLHHEHQNPQYWKVSVSDIGGAWAIPTFANYPKRFATANFDCQNLKDYQQAVARVQAKIDAATDPTERDGLTVDLTRLCTSHYVAQKYRFSGSEWIPLTHLNNLVMDAEFDENSIMLYPSSAGATGLGANRATVMVYNDGSRIQENLVPSPMDINRLVSLYGTPASSVPKALHNSKSSRLRSVFSKSRLNDMFKRAGDTSAGLC